MMGMRSWEEESLKRQRRATFRPSLAEERGLNVWGYRFIAGIDEVGRGPLAGPVVAAAVILPPDLDAPWLDLVRDSKKLTAKRRESLLPSILGMALGVGVGLAFPEDIDAVGIMAATRHAMCSAVELLPHPPDFLLIDHVGLPGLPIPQKSITRGDSLCLSIACASIVAKVSRDRIMIAMDEAYPGYGFARNKGYATREHLEGLRCLGPCPIHRKCFIKAGGIE